MPSRAPPPKHLKSKIRELAGLAYSRALSAELGKLEAQFAEWRAQTLSPFELNQLIHEFHDGISRDLYKQYVTGEAEWAVAVALNRGLLSESDVGAELFEHMKWRLDFLNRDSEDESE